MIDTLIDLLERSRITFRYCDFLTINWLNLLPKNLSPSMTDLRLTQEIPEHLAEQSDDTFLWS